MRTRAATGRHRVTRRPRPGWSSAAANRTVTFRRRGAGLVAGAVLLAGCASARATASLGDRRPTTTASAGPAPVSAAPSTTTTTAPPSATSTTGTTAAAAGQATGQWSPIGRIVNGVPALTARLVAATPGGPLVGVVRIDPAVTRLVLYAGSAEPGGAWPNQGAVAPALRPALIAAFNAGFHTSASGGGWFDHGRVAVALRPGAASLVIRADGSSTVGMWGRDVSLTPDVVSVRQNLGLLVDAGANLSGAGTWGATLGGVRYTWRSGVGVDAAGNLLYCGGPGLDARSLAQVLIEAGAVRAMELDINPQWVALSYYPALTSGADLLPSMRYGPAHWLSGSSRDFFAVLMR